MMNRRILGALAASALTVGTISCHGPRIQDTGRLTAFDESEPNKLALGTVAYTASIDDGGHSFVSVPFDVVPTGSGFQPTLALAYQSSGSGNLSRAVPGWSLNGILSIVRCTKTLVDDGSYSGINFSKDDRFCFSGKRLALTAGTYGEDQSEYRTVPDEFHRFIYHKPSAADPGFFEVSMKTGERALIGESDDARELDRKGRGAFSWHLNSLIDRSGNFILFHFSKSDPASIPEPALIEYGGNEVTGVPSSRSIRFEWRKKDLPVRWKNGSENQLAGIPTAIRFYNRDALVHSYEFAYEPRALSVFENLTAVRKCYPSGKCLKATKFAFQGGQAPGFSDEQLTNKELSFDSSTDFDSAKSYRFYDDIDGDGFRDFLSISKRGEAFLAKGIKGGHAAPVKIAFDNAFYTSMNKNSRGDPLFLVDSDGDGISDLVFLAFGVPTAQQGIYVAKGTGTTFENFVKVGEPSVKWDLSRHLPTIADVNSDSRPDILMYHEDGVVWYRNTGHSFEFAGLAVSNFSIKTGWTFQQHPRYLADINGDGYPDIVGMHDNGVQVSYGNGTGFAPAVTVLQDFGAKQGYTISGTPRYVIDINGDGLPDIVAFVNAGITVSLNTGNGFQPASLWLADLGYNQGWGSTIKGQRLLLDLNNDGLMDFIGLSPSGITAYINKGQPFSSIEEAAGFRINKPMTSLSSWIPTSYFAIPVDNNSDGTDDLSIMLRGGLWTLPTSYDDILLKNVTDAYGNVAEFGYEPANSPTAYQQSGDPVSFPLAKISGTRPLATSLVSRAPGFADRILTQTYRDGIMHTQGRGFLGYKKIRSEDSASHLITEKTFSDGADGNPEGATLLVQTYLRRPNSLTRIGAITNHWKKARGSGGMESLYWYPDIIQTDSYAPEDGSLLSHVIREESFDNHGNLASSKITSRDAYSTNTTSTIHTYSDVEDKWQLGRLTRTEVTATDEPLDKTIKASSVKKVSSFAYDSNGQLYSSTTEPDSTYQQTETYSRLKNRFGLIDTVSKSWANPVLPLWAAGAKSLLGPSSSTVIEREFDGDGFLRVERNALGHQKTTYINSSFGSAERTVNANGVEESLIIGEQGLVDSSIDKDGVNTKFFYEPCDEKCPKAAVYRTRTLREKSGTVTSYFNSKSLEIRRESEGFQGRISVKDQEYDLFGKVVRASQPYFLNDNKITWDQYIYDDMQRLVRIERADGAVSQRIYNGQTTTEIDPDGRKTVKDMDSKGRIWKIANDKNETLLNRFDADGHIIETINPRGISIIYAFDTLGRKTSETDPDRGLLETIYDGRNLPIATKDALGQVTLYQYDSIKRMLKRIRSSGATDSFEYDKGDNALGLLTAEQNDASRRTRGYDKAGRISQELIEIVRSGQKTVYEMGMTYDEQGRISTQTWPSAAVRYDYDGYGVHSKTVNLSDGKPLWTLSDTTASGLAKKETLGNGLTTTIDRDIRNDRITGIATTDASGRLVLGETYDYHPSGDVRLKADNSVGYQEVYEYDNLHRLRVVRDGNGIVKESLDYDDLGNITKKQSQGAFVYGDQSCQGQPVPLHAPSSFEGRELCYDRKGQMLSDGLRKVTYNFEGQPLNIKAGTKSEDLTYDVMGRLILDERSGQNPGATITPFENYDIEDGPDGYVERVRIAGRILVEKKSGTGTAGVKYFHTDRIGSLVGITDSIGQLIEKLAFDSFGKRIVPETRAPLLNYTPDSTRIGYTGHRQLDDMGLIHMRGRLYDPARGQFLSADGIIQEPLSLQSYNRYLYVQGNPLTIVDPSGFLSIGDVFREVGNAIDGISGAFGRLAKWLSKDQNQRMLVAVAIMAVTAWYTWPYSLQMWQLYVYSAAGGALSAGVMTRGNTDAMVRGAVTAVAFAMVGSYWKAATGDYTKILQPLSQGVVSGLSTQANGGRFETGFAVGIVSSGLAVSGTYEALGMMARPQEVWEYAYNASLAGAVGGMISEYSGGDFANGAITAAFQRLYGDINTSVFEPASKKLLDDERKLWDAAKKFLPDLKKDIDFDPVRLTSHKFFPTQPDDVAITPSSNTIYFPGLKDDMSLKIGDAALLVHELVHVWQFQNGIDVLCRALPLQLIYWGTFKYIDVYEVPNWTPFSEMTVEQQAAYIANQYYDERSSKK